MPCPFSDTVAIFSEDSEGYNYTYPYGYNINFPDVITEAYSSGTNNDTTVSNYWDIQWRRYVTTSSKDTLWNYNNGSTYLVGAFRLMETMVLNVVIKPVEGLVVDMMNGGIGFRNHTIPPGFQYGVSWEEDLLFIEPETVCVDTNVTVDFSVSVDQNASTTVIDLVLTDRGGFVNLNQSYPYINYTDPQRNPDLTTRAYNAAFLTNAYTMLYYNITNPHDDATGRQAFSYMNSKEGQTFLLVDEGSSIDWESLAMDWKFDEHLNFYFNNSLLNDSSTPSLPTNPFHITDGNFSDIGMECAGAGPGDYANITNIFVTCGLMRGVPHRSDGGSDLTFDSGSKWSQPLYTCASAVKATIKTVSFTFNGTYNELSSLIVNSVRPKEYPDEASKPLWGVEDTGNAYKMYDIKLVWGLVSNDYENHPNVSSVRQESLYLPGQGYYAGLVSAPDSVTVSNQPASTFFLRSMGSAYDVGGTIYGNHFDYTGSSSFAMWTRWQELSRDPTKAARIPNLIFTDYGAASVVGTKGVLGPGNAAAKSLVALLVTPNRSRIKYHWPFAIPAFLVILCVLGSSGAAFIALLFGKGSFRKMREHLNQTSPGRLVTTMLFRDAMGLKMGAKQWNREMGGRVVDMSNGFPVMEEVGMHDKPVVPVFGYTNGARGPEEERFLGSGSPNVVSPGFYQEDGNGNGRGREQMKPMPYEGVRGVSPL